MAVSAALTIPVTVTTQARHDELASVFFSALGSSDISIDAYAAKAMLRFQFPGDIDAMMRELYRRGLTNTATVALSIGIADPRGGAFDARSLVGRLAGLPAVSNVSFDGKVLSATIAAATGALRSFHDEIVSDGLVPIDTPARTRA